MKNIRSFIEAVFENADESQKIYKEELLSNYQEEFDDLCKSGLSETQAELTIMNRLGSVYEYQEELGILHIHNKAKFQVSLWLLVVHLFINIVSLIYGLSFYVPRVSLPYPFSFLSINMYVVVLYVIVSTLVQLIFFIIFKTVSILDPHNKLNIIYLVFSLMALPFSFIGLILIFGMKKMNIITYLQTKSPIHFGLSSTMKKIAKQIILLAKLCLTFLLVVSVLRHEVIIDQYELIEHNYNDSNRGINLYGKIYMRDQDFNNIEFQLDSVLSIHYTNFDTFDTLYFQVRFGNQIFYFEDNELERRGCNEIK
jgi:hypothetical protein